MIIKLFVKPTVTASGDLTFYEDLGIFAPVFYMFEVGVKILEGLSPIVKFIREILFVINSVLLVVSLIITRYVFKNAIWAGVVIVLLSAPLWVLLFG